MKQSRTVLLALGVAVIFLVGSYGYTNTQNNPEPDYMTATEINELVSRRMSGLAFSLPSDLDVNSIDVKDFYLNGEYKTDLLAYPELGVSYVIFKEGSTIYAKNGKTGQIDYSGINITLIQENVLSTLTNGTMFLNEVQFNTSLSIPKNVIVIEQLNGVETKYGSNNIENHGKYSVSFVPFLIYPDNLLGGDDYRAYSPLRYHGMIISPSNASVWPYMGSPYFHAVKTGVIFRENDYGIMEKLCTFNTTKGDIRSIGHNIFGHFLIIAGPNDPYTAYYYLSATDVDNDNVNSEQADVHIPFQGTGMENLYTNTGVHGFIWAEYTSASPYHRVWRVTQAGAADAVFTVTLNITSENTRHLHHLDWDIYNPNTCYVTGGDGGSKIRWWVSNDYGVTWTENPDGIGGTQQYRTLRIGFTEDYLYWATDTSILDGQVPQFIRAPRSDLTSLEVLKNFEPYYLGFSITQVWEPYGFLIWLQDPYDNGHYDTIPVYFHDLKDNETYLVYEFESRNSDSGIFTSSPYQSLYSGKIYIETFQLYHDPIRWFPSDYRRVMAIRLQRSNWNVN